MSTGRRRASVRARNGSSGRINDHFLVKKSASLPKHHSPGPLEPNSCQSLQVSDNSWAERIKEQADRVSRAREEFQERLRDQKLHCGRIEELADGLAQLLSEAVGPKKYADTEPWAGELGQMRAGFRGRQGLSTIVVVGDTGTGKSSLLNAILDESSVLPTNCNGRACTGPPSPPPPLGARARNRSPRRRSPGLR